MVKPRGGEVMPVKIAPTAPDLLFHQTVDVMEMNRLHRLQELEGGMKEAPFFLGVQRLEILEPYTPDTGELSIVGKRTSHFAQRRGGRVLRGQLGDASAAMHLHSEIPK